MADDDNTSLSQEIGQRLRHARKFKGLSLNGLSERTGGAISTSRINNYERGIRRLSIEAARAGKRPWDLHPRVSAVRG